LIKQVGLIWRYVLNAVKNLILVARRSVGQRYGAGTYDKEYQDGDICDMSVREEMGTNYSAEAYIMSLMSGYQWD